MTVSRVLNARIYVEGEARDRAFDSARSVFKDRVGELDFDHEVTLRDDDRLAVQGAGEDAEAAVAALVEEFGGHTTDPDEGGRYVGTLEGWGDYGFTVDVGVDLTVSAEALEELGKGTPEDVRERYGLVQHTPLEVVYEGDGEARLSDEQVDELWSWRKGDKGRLNVNSCTRAEVRATTNRAGHADDVVRVERLGLLEQSVVCAPGTDPPGLLSSVGGYLKGEMKCVVV